MMNPLDLVAHGPVIPVIVLNDVAHAVPMAQALVAGWPALVPDLLPWLRPPDHRGLTRVLQQIISAKPERHSITREGYEHQNFTMSHVGG